MSYYTLYRLHLVNRQRSSSLLETEEVTYEQRTLLLIYHLSPLLELGV